MKPGTRLTHYEILSPLGKGGMGEVWRARDTKLGRDVAIKTLPEEFARDADRLARFEREARLLASLNHPNIAAIYGLEEHEGTRFLVLELVEGPTLADRIEQAAIPVEESLKLALQIAGALESAHENGIIHRDLKPANIKVTPDGTVKVLDFGLAKAFAGDTADASVSNSPTLSMAATQAGIILGTAAYMSPEQASGMMTDKRADIWSFGVVLFEMLAGRQMFTGESVSHVLAAVLREEPDWNRVPANLHPRIRLLLERCLEKKARDRGHDIADARADIEKVLADPNGVGVQPLAETPPTKPQSNLRWVAAIVLGIVVSGVAGWSLKPSEPARVTRFDYTLPDGRQFRATGQRVIAVSPDGRSFLYNSNEGLYLRSLGELDGRLIAGTEEVLANPMFSPDGQSIAYFATDGLKRIAIGGGAPVTLADADTVWGASWGPDDSIVYGQSDGIWRVSANGGTPARIVEPEAGELLYGPEFLPDGEWLLFTAATAGGVGRWDAGTIVAQSLESGERRTIWEGGSDAKYVRTGHLIFALENGLLALPFDADRLEVTGGAVPIIEGVQRSTNTQVNSGAAQYAFSVDGTLVFVPEPGPTPVGNLLLALVDRNGGVEQLNVPPAPYRSPRLSPDGQRMAVEMTGADGLSNIWIHDLFGTTQVRQLTRGGNNTRPIWTPDGERVTFASDRDAAAGIWWQRSDFSGVAERLTTAEEGVAHWPGSWHPDGQVLALTVQTRVGGDGLGVSTFGLDRGEVEVFYDPPRNQESPAFSPDGRWIAYSSFESGASAQVFLQPFPRTGEVHPITTTGEAHPMWSSDGGELFYRRSVTARAVPALSGVEITTEPPVRWTAQRTLPIEDFYVQPQMRSFDISPDGQKFLLAFAEDRPEPGDLNRPKINIVLNWHQELLERVPVD